MDEMKLLSSASSLSNKKQHIVAIIKENKDNLRLKNCVGEIGEIEMDDLTVEKQGWHLGTWLQVEVVDIFNDPRIRQQKEKGTKYKLRLNKNGLRRMKVNKIFGNVREDFIPFKNIYNFTVSKGIPYCLLVVMRDRKFPYRVAAYRFKDEKDPEILHRTFKELQTQRMQTESNWHLTNRRADEDGNYEEVELRKKDSDFINSQFSDLPATSEISSNKQEEEEPHDPVFLDHPLYTMVNKKKSKNSDTSASQDDEAQTKHRDDSDDQAHDTTEMSAMKDELKSLSEEVKQIKYLLEKSAGIKIAREWETNGHALPGDVRSGSHVHSAATNGHYVAYSGQSDRRDHQLSSRQADEAEYPNYGNPTMSHRRYKRGTHPSSTVNYETWSKSLIRESAPEVQRHHRISSHEESSHLMASRGRPDASAYSGMATYRPEPRQVSSRQRSVLSRNTISTHVFKPIEQVYPKRSTIHKTFYAGNPPQRTQFSLKA